MWNNGTQDTSFAGDGGFARDDGDQGGKNTKIQNMVHMHIADYLSQGEETLVCGQPVDMMVFCGKVDRIDPSAGMIEFEISDSTGNMKVKSLVEVRDESPMVHVSSLIRAVCSPKSMSGQKTALVLRMFPLPDEADEVRRHDLRVKYDKARIIEAGKQREMPTGGTYGGSAAGNVGGVATGAPPTASGPADMVARTFKQILDNMTNSDQGVNSNQVTSALRGKLSAEQVKNIIEELVADGTLFSTVDDNHFALT